MNRTRNRSRNRARQSVRNRRRWGWITALVVVLAVAGVITGLRLTRHTDPSAGPSAATAPTVGHPAPDGTFTTVAGTSATVASLRGRPTLLWFVATWCPSCQAGTPAIAQALPQLRAAGLRVVEVELYQNLGQPGPTVAEFGKSYAGRDYGDPDWVFGTSSAALTSAYDPEGYTDIYYLLDAAGSVTYINGQPASTLPDLLNHATGRT